MQRQTDYKFELILNILFGTTAILLLIGAAIFAIFDLPPADLINAWQVAILTDGYYPILTIAVLFLPAVIPLLLMKVFFIFIFNTFFVKNGEPKIPYLYKLRW